MLITQFIYLTLVIFFLESWSTNLPNPSPSFSISRRFTFFLNYLYLPHFSYWWINLCRITWVIRSIFHNTFRISNVINQICKTLSDYISFFRKIIKRRITTLEFEKHFLALFFQIFLNSKHFLFVMSTANYTINNTFSNMRCMLLNILLIV